VSFQRERAIEREKRERETERREIDR